MFIVQIMRIILITTGLFYVFDYFLNIVTCKECDIIFSEANQLRNNKYLEIDDKSKRSRLTEGQELTRIRKEILYLKELLHKNLLNKHLYLLSNYMDKNKDSDLPDFASEAVGGKVINTPSTQSYSTSDSLEMTILGLPLYKFNYYTPRKIIQPWREAGECWAFHGSRGKIEIELAYTAFIHCVTLEHILSSASITGNNNSAPKFFNVLGKLNDKYTIIGTFMYKNKGLSSQKFKITNSEVRQIPIKRVMLEILSNWGNENYTCIYRFKVHGKMYDSNNKMKI